MDSLCYIPLLEDKGAFLHQGFTVINHPVDRDCTSPMLEAVASEPEHLSGPSCLSITVINIVVIMIMIF